MRTSKNKNYTSLGKAKRIAGFSLKKQARDPVILEVKKISNICDYYVICSAASPAQVKAIYEEVIKESRKEKIKIQHKETDKIYHWILVDFSDVILHIFIHEARKFYNLEYLWRRAKKINFVKTVDI